MHANAGYSHSQTFAPTARVSRSVHLVATTPTDDGSQSPRLQHPSGAFQQPDKPAGCQWTSAAWAGSNQALSCAVQKRPIFSRCNSCPATVAPAGSNRSGGGGNETAEAFDGKDRIGDSASTQAVTCSERRAGLETGNVGADLAKGWGRPPSQLTGERLLPGCGPTGVMATACVHREIGCNTGNPSGGPTDQLDAREGQAGPCGVADRSVVPTKPGNAGGGKGPDFRSAVKAVRVRRVAMLPITSISRLGHRGSGLGRRRRRGRLAGPWAAA